MGNVIGVFTSTTVPQALVYQPFGELDSAASVLGTLADTNRLRWKGLMWEGDSTRLYYVRNRWYDPQAGRFLSEDPAGLMGGLNLYAFGGNDPINARDPQGLSSDCELVPVQIFDLVDGKVTQVGETAVSLCGDGGSTIGQILDFAATEGVGDGSAFWSGGIFATAGDVNSSMLDLEPWRVVITNFPGGCQRRPKPFRGSSAGPSFPGWVTVSVTLIFKTPTETLGIYWGRISSMNSTVLPNGSFGMNVSGLVSCAAGPQVGEFIESNNMPKIVEP